MESYAKEDICQLKALTLSINEELALLHSKQLFSNFTNNDIEFLLEDLKNGKFDEGKLKLQKRVEWHILNSFAPKTENVQNEVSENLIEVENRNEVQSQNSFHNRKSSVKNLKDLKQANLLPHRNENSVYKKPPLKRPIIRDRKYHHKSYENYDMFKERNVQVTHKSEQEFIKAPKLKMIFNPCINIPPLSRRSLPSVNIESEKKLSMEVNSSERKSKYLKEKSSILRSNLKKVTKTSVHIVPLSEQKLPSVIILPSKRKINKMTNQAFITCKYSQLSSENSDSSYDHTSSLSLKREKSPSEASIQAPKNRIQKRILNEVPSSEETDSWSHITENPVDIHLNHQNAFDSKRFIDRLEERLSSVLISLPNTKFSEKVAVNRHNDLVRSQEVQTLSDPYRSRQIDYNRRLSKSLKCSEASSQAGSPFKKISKDEFAQTCLPEENSTENSKELYNSSFENEESAVNDEKHSETIEAELTEKENTKDDQPLTSVEFSLEGTTKESEKHLNKETTTDESGKHLDKENTVDEQKHTVELSINNIQEKYEQKGLPNIESTEKELSHSVQLPETEASTLQTEEREITSSQLLPKTEDNKQEINVLGHNNNNEENQIKIAEKSTISELPSSERDENVESKCSGDQNSSPIESENHHFDNAKPEYPNSKEIDSFDASKTFKESSQNSNSSVRISNFESVEETILPSIEETILPSIEIGDVTISDGEIEFEASISDIQPCNRISIKFSTKDFGISANHFNHSPLSHQLVHKETQTEICDSNVDIIYDSSFSEGILQPQSEKEMVLSDVSEENEETTINFSEGELLGKESPPPEIFLDPKEKEFFQRENQILRERLATFTGRFCLN